MTSTITPPAIDRRAFATIGCGIVLVGGGFIGFAALLRIPAVHDASMRLVQNPDVRKVSQGIIAAVADHVAAACRGEAGPFGARLPA
ncbi:hypothetical protein [Agromyces mariniharenae]|uniref:Uncharacterized protein n=1 Tax=Agromyces mariniharenae TaxID=2604423 RepID=A0A5S4V816_9MICO|nr:hypothetical protein [Agromyces mariniharenae]TYL54023.1 hypothetical protein FYC51_10525 [Agromyces mariniharenae]